jgi:hypothetical protein
MTGSDELYPKPGIRDWALLAIGIVFVLCGCPRTNTHNPVEADSVED